MFLPGRHSETKLFHRPLGLQWVNIEVTLGDRQAGVAELPSAKASDDHSAA